MATLSRVLSPDQLTRLLSNVLLTGGHTLVPGFDSRIQAELTMINPVGTPISVVRAYDP